MAGALEVGVPERQLGRAVSVVLGGATLGMVVGTPLARLVTDLTSWRVAFALLALAVLAVAVLVRLLVPARPRTSGPRGASQVRRAPFGPVAVVLALVGTVLVGFYGTYTFITRLGEPAATLLPGGMSTLLLAFGIASATGVALTGRVTRTATALVVSASATGTALLGLTLASWPVAGVVVVLVLGMASGALSPLAQTEVLRRAGVAHRDLASSLIPVVFNGGIAVGAAAASVIVDQAGPGGLPVPAAAVVLAAAGGLLLAIRSRR